MKVDLKGTRSEVVQWSRAAPNTAELRVPCGGREF